MIKCDESCIPCCDYCIHAQYERQPIAGRIVTGCAKHEDDKHKKMARNLGYCEDFCCINRVKIMLLEKRKNELHKN